MPTRDELRLDKLAPTTWALAIESMHERVKCHWLGGTGKESGSRHPKIGDGVLIGADVQILGNIRIGDRAKIGAGSTVITGVPKDTTIVGVAARELHRQTVPGTTKPLSAIEQMPVAKPFQIQQVSQYSYENIPENVPRTG